MNVKNPNVYESELGGYLSKFEKRIRESGHFGFLLHTGVSKRILDDLEKAQEDKDKKIYRELMQLEGIAKRIAAKRIKEFPATENQEVPKDESAKLLNKIYELKGIVGVICLGVISLTMLPNVHAIRRPNSGCVKVEDIEMEVKIWNN